MKSTITPVDELDTEFLSHPPRPLFANIQDKIGANVPPPPIGLNNWINGANNLVNGSNNLVFSKGV